MYLEFCTRVPRGVGTENTGMCGWKLLLQNRWDLPAHQLLLQRCPFAWTVNFKLRLMRFGSLFGVHTDMISKRASTRLLSEPPWDNADHSLLTPALYLHFAWQDWNARWLQVNESHAGDDWTTKQQAAHENIKISGASKAAVAFLPHSYRSCLLHTKLRYFQEFQSWSLSKIRNELEFEIGCFSSPPSTCCLTCSLPCTHDTQWNTGRGSWKSHLFLGRWTTNVCVCVHDENLGRINCWNTGDKHTSLSQMNLWWIFQSVWWPKLVFVIFQDLSCPPVIVLHKTHDSTDKKSQYSYRWSSGSKVERVISQRSRNFTCS